MMNIENDYNVMYKKIFKIIGELTPMTVDCGVLCGCACCKGDENTGMLLFPKEESKLKIRMTENGDRLTVCDGICDRSTRPLACRIFPFFPTIDEYDKIFVELDSRAYRLCPMIEHCDELLFDPKFLKAVKKVGKILAKNAECKAFLKRSTAEIDLYNSFLD